MSNYGMKKEDIIDFIQNHTQNKLYENLIDYIIKFLPKMCSYYEEGERIIFDICIGYNLEENCTFTLNKIFELDLDHFSEERLNYWIKSLAILCKKDANIYLSQKNNTVECGIWYSNIYSGVAAENIIVNDYAIRFSYLGENQILIYSKTKKAIVDFDFLDESINEIELFDKTKYRGTVKIGWKDIFKVVKRIVHGTICLIVNEDWDINDCNFKNADGSLDFIEIKKLNINLTEDMKNSKIELFQRHKDMLINMLNYDGITILNTRGYIVAYNAFVHSSSIDMKCIGGARTRAKNSLKSNKQNGYVGLYYQSQEGKIEFYNYMTDISCRWFRPDIMEEQIEIRKNFNEAIKYDDKLSPDEINDINELNELAMSLKFTHDEMNNFYREYEPAERLLEYMNKKGRILINGYLARHDVLLWKCVSATVDCILGNAYGRANNAQDTLTEIVKLISVDNWVKYIDTLLDDDFDILWSLMCNDQRHDRWKTDIVNNIDLSKESYDVKKKFDISVEVAETKYSKVYEND